MDPKRLTELSAEDPTGALERELLSSLKPPGGARDEVWRRLAGPGVLVLGASAAGVTAAATKASASTGLVATGSSMLTTAKLGVLLAVAAPVAAGAIYVAQSSPAPQASAPQVLVAAPARQAEPRAASEVLPAPAEPAEAAKPPTADKVDKAAPEQSAITEENRLLREARAASRAGDAAGALATLRVLDKRFPGGALLQERELLRVQALRAQGSHAEAEQRARRFLKLYPSSPYASHMKASLADKAP